MNHSFLILSFLLFTVILGLNLVQVAKVPNTANHDPHDEGVYDFNIPKTAIASVSEEDRPTPIANLLAEADAALGPQVAARCTTCHSFEKDGGNRIGPALWNVVGRDIASREDFNYSSALSEIEGNWTAEALDGFLLKPKAWVAGTKMGFVGLKDEVDRANLIAWMYQQSDAPLALPQPVSE